MNSLYKYLLLALLLCISFSCEKDKLEKFKPPTIEGDDLDPSNGANLNDGAGDNEESDYYVNPDFYHMVSNSKQTIISGFKTMQQTTAWSCGNVAALLVLYHYGIEDETEESLAIKFNTSVDSSKPGSKPGSAVKIEDFGTKISEMYKYFANRPDISIVETSYKKSCSDKDLVKEGDFFPTCDYGNLYPTFTEESEFSAWITNHLKASRPIMVEWSDWDGHWAVIIGIDNNGTPSFYGDDILIFADSYDTTDHWQDGYSIAQFERFFSLWKDRVYAPKPFQLQPFIVVEKKNQ